MFTPLSSLISRNDIPSNSFLTNTQFKINYYFLAKFSFLICLKIISFVKYLDLLLKTKILDYERDYLKLQ